MKTFTSLFFLVAMRNYFPLYSSETVNFLRPFARRDANTLRPFALAILSRNPCLFFLFLLEGWNVLFIVYSSFYCYIYVKSGCKDIGFF